MSETIHKGCRDGANDGLCGADFWQPKYLDTWAGRVPVPVRYRWVHVTCPGCLVLKGKRKPRKGKSDE